MVNDRTLEEFKKAGVDYMFKGNDDYLNNEREKTSEDKNKKRRINAMYRLRSNEGSEYILYQQDIIATSNHTRNRIQYYEDVEETSMYKVPIVERQLTYDQETEKQRSEVKQIQSIEIHYSIPFTKENVMELKPFTNLSTQYHVQQENGMMRNILHFEDWLELPFQVLLDGGVKIEEYKALQEEQQQNILEQQEVTPAKTKSSSGK
jgi:hypothetical protein